MSQHPVIFTGSLRCYAAVLSIAFLDRETEKIDTLVTKIEAVIERLQEYRSVFITSAVTGKIDVREEAPL